MGTAASLHQPGIGRLSVTSSSALKRTCSAEREGKRELRAGERERDRAEKRQREIDRQTDRPTESSMRRFNQSGTHRGVTSASHAKWRARAPLRQHAQL